MCLRVSEIVGWERGEGWVGWFIVVEICGSVSFLNGFNWDKGKDRR